jgi:hypothetical protein
LNDISQIFDAIAQGKDVREDVRILTAGRQIPTGGASPSRCSQCGKPLP